MRTKAPAEEQIRALATVTLDAQALDELGPQTMDRLADLVAAAPGRARRRVGEAPLLTAQEAGERGRARGDGAASDPLRRACRSRATSGSVRGCAARTSRRGSPASAAGTACRRAAASHRRHARRRRRRRRRGCLLTRCGLSRGSEAVVSVHRIERPDGSVVWRVRWRDGGRGSRRARGRSTRKGDAQRVRRRAAAAAAARRDRAAGRLAGDAREYVAETWAPTHAVTLAPATAKGYAALYDVHIAPHLGRLKLGEITPEVDRALAGGADRGRRRARVGAEGADAARRDPAARAGVRADRAQPGAAGAQGPPAGQERGPPAGARDGRGDARGEPTRDATLISVLAYAGLRPQEALALRWRDIGERTLMVNAPKTGQRRNVRLLAPLLEDLHAWRTAQASSDADALVFPGHDGEPWTEEAYKSWARKAPRGRKRQGRTTRAGSPGPFGRAAKAAGVPSATPYTLRHSFCSLLLHEGRSVIYVARQLGPRREADAVDLRARDRRARGRAAGAGGGRDRAAREARVSLVCHERRRRECTPTGLGTTKPPAVRGFC